VKKKLKIILFVQILLFIISYYFFRLIIKKTHKWIIGVDEIASNIFFYGNILDDSLTVSLSKNKFYNLKYDYHTNIKNKYIHFFLRSIYGPLLLGYLIHKADNFFYIWHTGFLIDREFEFKFLKSKDKNIICRFLGDDIRSLILMKEHSIRSNLDCRINYRTNVNNIKYDNEKKRIAYIADKYADIIFNNNKDQISYLKSNIYKTLIPYENFTFNINKYSNINNVKILHAPSNPINKGTPLVRAALKKLELEGYSFDYIELQDVPNKVVLEHLASAHIVLNQFYSSAAGLFGVEGISHYCCVLQSADYYFKPTEKPWLQTKYYEIYDKLKFILDNPLKMECYASNGYKFAKTYHTNEAVKKQLYKIFEENNII
jgi:hypothetical protein